MTISEFYNVVTDWRAGRLKSHLGVHDVYLVHDWYAVSWDKYRLDISEVKAALRGFNTMHHHLTPLQQRVIKHTQMTHRF